MTDSTRRPCGALTRFTLTSGSAWATRAKPRNANIAFPPYQVNDGAHGGRCAQWRVHALPARASQQEVTDAVIDSPRSVVFEQAENRMHIQKAILAMLVRLVNRPSSR